MKIARQTPQSPELVTDALFLNFTNSNYPDKNFEPLSGIPAGIWL